MVVAHDRYCFLHTLLTEAIFDDFYEMNFFNVLILYFHISCMKARFVVYENDCPSLVAYMLREIP